MSFMPQPPLPSRTQCYLDIETKEEESEEESFARVNNIPGLEEELSSSLDKGIPPISLYRELFRNYRPSDNNIFPPLPKHLSLSN